MPDTETKSTMSVISGDDLLKPEALKVGAYVVVALDSVASLLSVEDPLARFTVREMRPGNYVALVQQVYTRPSSTHPLKASLSLIAHGPPTRTANSVADPSMSTPIHPVPASEHPLRRAAVVPDQPLPWDDAWHHSLMNVTVVVGGVQRLYEGCEVMLGMDGIRRLEGYTALDRARERVLLEALDEEERRAEAARMAEEADTEDDDEYEEVARARIAPYVYADTETGTLETSTEDTPASESDFDTALFEDALTTQPLSPAQLRHQASNITHLSFPAPLAIEEHDDEEDELYRSPSPSQAVQTPPCNILEFVSCAELVVNLSTDLSQVESLPDPRAFFEEVDAIYALEKEAEERAADIPYKTTPDSKNKKALRIASWLDDASPPAESDGVFLPPVTPLSPFNIPTPSRTAFPFSPVAKVDFSLLHAPVAASGPTAGPKSSHSSSSDDEGYLSDSSGTANPATRSRLRLASVFSKSRSRVRLPLPRAPANAEPCPRLPDEVKGTKLSVTRGLRAVKSTLRIGRGRSRSRSPLPAPT